MNKGLGHFLWPTRDVLGVNRAIFGYPSLSQSLGYTFISSSWSKMLDLPLEFRRYLSEFQRYISISGFGGHLRLSIIIGISSNSLWSKNLCFTLEF